jgi:hypothetical protein
MRICKFSTTIKKQHIIKKKIKSDLFGKLDTSLLPFGDVHIIAV